MMKPQCLDDLSMEERLVLLLSRSKISENIVDLCNGMIRKGINWDYFIRKCDVAGTSPIIYKNIKNINSVPEGVMERLKVRYLASLRHNVLLKEEIKKILLALKERGIEAVPLKGPIASEQVFNDIALYTASDIDILVRPSDLDEARRIIVDIGYSQQEGFNEGDFVQTSYHLPPYARDGFYLEIHWNLTMKYFHSNPEFWWEELDKIEIDGERFPCLSPERYLLYTIFRLFSHAFYPLKFHLLIASLIAFNRAKIDWDKLLSVSRKLGMEKLTDFTLSMMKEFFDLEVPVRFRTEGILIKRIKCMVLKGLFDVEPILTRRMIVYCYLHDSLKSYLYVLLRRLFPRIEEVRSRYGIEPGSKKIAFYYILNPFHLFLGRKR